MLIVTNQVAPAPNNRIAALMEERLGVTISYELVTPEMQAERISVLITGGGAGMPDILATTDREVRLTQQPRLLYSPHDFAEYNLLEFQLNRVRQFFRPTVSTIHLHIHMPYVPREFSLRK